MQREAPARITLDQVYEVYSGYGLPLIDQTTHRSVGIDEFYQRDLQAQVTAQINNTMASIRANEQVPQTVMHALMMGDEQTIGQIAAKMHADPRKLHHDLGTLVETGWATISDVESVLPRFSLMPLPEQP